MVFAPGSKLGPFATIGAGGIGKVYRARNTKLERDVALKVLQEAFAYDRDRMDDSSVAQLLASLNHSNIAPIYGLEELDRAILLAVNREGTLSKSPGVSACVKALLARL